MDKNKVLDLRFVIGVFFTIVGLLLFGYSFRVVYAINAIQMREVNRWCGISFLIFGIVMIALSFIKNADDELVNDGTADKSV